MSYLLTNKLTTKPGKRAEVTELLLTSGKAFDDIDACLMYLVTHDAGDEDVIWVHDVWTDEEAHQQAMAAPEMREHIRAAIPLLEGMPEQHVVIAVGGKTPFGATAGNS